MSNQVGEITFVVGMDVEQLLTGSQTVDKVLDGVGKVDKRA